MRLMVFFDLPMLTAMDRKRYRQFRVGLLKSGFMMLQKSVYCKIVLNPVMAQLLSNTVRNLSPKDGVVQMMLVTEKQFSKIETVVGEISSSVLNTDARLVVL